MERLLWVSFWFLPNIVCFYSRNFTITLLLREHLPRSWWRRRGGRKKGGKDVYSWWVGGCPITPCLLLLCSSIHSQLTHQHRGRKQTVYGLYVSSVCVSFPSFICHQDVCYVSCGLWSAIYNTITLMSLFITIDFWLDNDWQNIPILTSALPSWLTADQMSWCID